MMVERKIYLQEDIDHALTSYCIICRIDLAKVPCIVSCSSSHLRQQQNASTGTQYSSYARNLAARNVQLH